MNIPDWLKEKLNQKSKSKNKRIPLKMLNHGSNSTLLNWKIVKKDLLDNKHGMQSNQKSMKPKLLKELPNKKLLTDSKSTLARSYPPLLNLLPAEIDLIINTSINNWITYDKLNSSLSNKNDQDFVLKKWIRFIAIGTKDQIINKLIPNS
ncbi:unnamed protein product [Paramecium primaurelia]|uniref:Uncharacterized protein n=1 Tax=Paramecium primaurelia TaxID=5886 RepID=A0A8S1LQQ7_PARPR|nr:unnamed protein product [Paramecium primaurelia]